MLSCDDHKAILLTFSTHDQPSSSEPTTSDTTQSAYDQCRQVRRRKATSKFSGQPIECTSCGKVFANKYAKSTKTHIEKCDISAIESWQPVSKEHCKSLIGYNPLLRD